MLIAGSRGPRVFGPTELFALMTRACPCRLDRSPLPFTWRHRPANQPRTRHLPL